MILSRERQEFNRGARGLKPGRLNGVEREKYFMSWGGGAGQVQVEGCTGPEVGKQEHKSTRDAFRGDLRRAEVKAVL